MDAKSSTLIQDALSGKPGAAKTASGKATAGSTTDPDIAETCELKQFSEDHRNTDHRGGA